MNSPSSQLSGMNPVTDTIIPMDHVVVGTCSICRGPVTQFAGVWMGTKPPSKSCAACGARPVAEYGPVIPMAPFAAPQNWPPPDDNQLNLWP